MSEADLNALGERKLARIGLRVVEHWIEAGGDLDLSEVFDMLHDERAIESIPGGYDPGKHSSGNHDPLPGDPWYELAADVKSARKTLCAKPQPPEGREQ